ncbi:MAG TPA: hypothetical protein VN495_02380 [Candidatus Paceibacterota bacterium]|nr:hypothetical protein [Candidatus Paceibacterota bacterium]
MKAIRKIILSWLPLAVAITGLCLLIHLTVQQNYRQSLNDPQIQMAEDAANQIDSGVAPGALFGGIKATDIGASLSPWLAVFDSSGTMIVSSGSLDGQALKLPDGLFDVSSWRGPIVGHHLVSNSNEDIVSWQPRLDVRQAIVIIPAGKYFVVAGRNMREVENREAALGTFVFLAWICIMSATLLVKAFAVFAA